MSDMLFDEKNVVSLLNIFFNKVSSVFLLNSNKISR